MIPLWQRRDETARNTKGKLSLEHPETCGKTITEQLHSMLYIGIQLSKNIIRYAFAIYSNLPLIRKCKAVKP